MDLRTSEAAISVTMWTMICVASLAFLPVWHLLISLIVCINFILLLLLVQSRLQPRDFRLTHTIFSILWNPFLPLFSFSSLLYTQPHLQQEEKHWPWNRGIPTWVRHQAFVISLLTMSSWKSHDLLSYLSWTILLYSLLSLIEELFGLENGQYAEFNHRLENIDSHSSITLKYLFDDLNFICFCSVNAVVCAILMLHIFASTMITDICITIVFACVSHTPIQHGAMIKFRITFPHVMDGLGELALLGVILTVDFIASGRLFVLAVGDDNSSLLLISVTYCNAFAALMEFRIRVWLRLKNERMLVQRMRWASKEEVMSYNDVCAICLVPMTSARVTVCQHLFHGKCLRLSLKTNTQCPLCKATLLPTLGHGHVMF